MEQTKNTFPTEEVTLPSKGLLYPTDSPLRKGAIEMRYMTAQHEDILTNQNLIENGTVIDKLLKSLIVTDISYSDLLIGDKNAILIASRILGYGSEYTFEYKGEEITVDLTSIKDKPVHKELEGKEDNLFDFTLPSAKVNVSFKLLTHGDEVSINQELKGLKKIGKGHTESSTRMKYMIKAVSGDMDVKTIREFVDNQLLARDARALRNHMSEIQPDIDLSFEHEDRKGNTTKVQVPIGVGFFWPDA